MPQCGNKHTPDSTRKEGIYSRVTKAHCQQLKLHDSMSLHRGEGQGGPRWAGGLGKEGADEHHQISMPGLMVPTAAKLPGWESPAGRQSSHARDRGKAGSMMS